MAIANFAKLPTEVGTNNKSCNNRLEVSMWRDVNVQPSLIG